MSEQPFLKNNHVIVSAQDQYKHLINLPEMNFHQKISILSSKLNKKFRNQISKA